MSINSIKMNPKESYTIIILLILIRLIPKLLVLSHFFICTFRNKFYGKFFCICLYIISNKISSHSKCISYLNKIWSFMLSIFYTIRDPSCSAFLFSNFSSPLIFIILIFIYPSVIDLFLSFLFYFMI